MNSTPRYQDDEMVEAARRSVAAAEEASQAAETDPATPEAVRKLTLRVVQEAMAVLVFAESSPRNRRRQSVGEFTSLLGEELKEAAEESFNEGKRYAERTLRQAKSLIEDHFQIDEAFRMLGPLRQDSNLARDVHDWFNLVALVPVIILNFSNWSCSDLRTVCGILGGVSVTEIWHGEAFLLFWWTTLAYFVLDILWMLILPQCVKSPKVILQHHFATIGYIIVPYIRPRYGYLMGSCMIVEVNTWFLIARRSFNKKGDKMFQPGVPLLKSLRLLAVSSCFYMSWFAIRLFFYPYLLIVIVQEWLKLSNEIGSLINIMTITPFMQLIFIFLNIKWTIDLIRSKLKGRGPGKGL